MAKAPRPVHARLSVRLTPNGGRDAVDGLETGPAGEYLLRARVSAPPEGGKANKALVALLAKALKVPKTSIEIVSGETARTKILRIGVEPEDLSDRLEAIRITS